MNIQAILEKYFSEVSLTEEAKTEIEAMFEAALKESVDKKVAEKEQVIEEKYTEDAKAFKADLIEDLSNYLEEAFGEWFAENKPAMIAEETIAMAESTVTALRGALEKNYVSINEEEVNVVEDLKRKVDDLTTKLDEQGNSLIDQKNKLFEYKKAVNFTKIAEDMAASDRDKLLSLVEDIEVSDIDAFTEKVMIIKEKFMVEDKTKNKTDDLSEKNDKEDPDTEIQKEEIENPLDKYVPKAFV